MSDPAYWDEDMVEEVFRVVRACPQHTFMFLSKDYFAYDAWGCEDNVMLGLTMTQCDNHVMHARVNKFLDSAPVPFENQFISAEPLLGCFKNTPDDFFKEFFFWFDLIGLVIVGAMTGPGATPPEQEWIQSIIGNVSANKIYWKRNIRKHLPSDIRADLTEHSA